MVYKSLNTFIDDLFAFVIKMPIMHRLSCFRDDLIFFIYLYQVGFLPVPPVPMRSTRPSDSDALCTPARCASRAHVHPDPLVCLSCDSHLHKPP